MKLILENESDTLKLGAAISNAMQEVEYEKMEIHLSGN